MVKYSLIDLVRKEGLAMDNENKVAENTEIVNEEATPKNEAKPAPKKRTAKKTAVTEGADDNSATENADKKDDADAPKKPRKPRTRKVPVADGDTPAEASDKEPAVADEEKPKEPKPRKPRAKKPAKEEAAPDKIEEATEKTAAEISEVNAEAVAEVKTKDVTEIKTEAVAEVKTEDVTETKTEAVDELKTDEGTDTSPEEADEKDESGEDESPVTDEDNAADSFILNVEHFSDYRSKKELEEEAKRAKDEAEEAAVLEEPAPPIDECIDEQDVEDFTDEIREYENMTILDELDEEPEAPRAPRERRKREADPDEEKYSEEKHRSMADPVFDVLELFIFTLVVIMLITTFFFKHSVVEGESMEGTLHEGDRLIISDLFYEPEQYDIIVCQDYSTGLTRPIVKRVIATEGQHVLVISLDEVYVDGQLVDTSFIHVDGEELSFIHYPINLTVPEGEVFVMGDHRNNSLDSRQLGTIDEDAILGKVLIRIYPFNKFGRVN